MIKKKKREKEVIIAKYPLYNCKSTRKRGFPLNAKVKHFIKKIIKKIAGKKFKAPCVGT